MTGPTDATEAPNQPDEEAVPPDPLRAEEVTETEAEKVEVENDFA